MMREDVKLVEEIPEDFGSGPDPNSSENVFSSTAWIGWLALGIRETIGSLDGVGSTGDTKSSRVQRTSSWFQGAVQNDVITATSLPLSEKDHSKSSQFSPAVEVEDDRTKVGHDQAEIPNPEPTRRRRVVKRQPTGDAADFAILLASKNGPPTTRRGRKNRGVQDADNSQSQEDSTSGGGATASESSMGSRCKPLLERKATGDEVEWNQVLSESPRRGRRKPNQGDHEEESESKASTSLTRPVVRRQPTGDCDTIGGFQKPRVGARRGRKSSATQQASDETAPDNEEERTPSRRTRKVIERTPTGDFSEGDPVSPKKNSNDVPKQGPERSRPTVRRQPTGDDADFAVLAAPRPRRGRRNRDHSEVEQSENNEDSTESQTKTRRSRPVVRRQATGDACDFASLQSGLTSAPSRPKRRPRHVEDQSNSQSDSEEKYDASAGSDTNGSNTNNGATDVIPDPNGEARGRRSRPLMRRQPTGDLDDFAIASSSGQSGTRKGRRKESSTTSSSSSEVSSPVRQVTVDGSTVVTPVLPQSTPTKEAPTPCSIPVDGDLVSSADYQKEYEETADLESNTETSDFDCPKRGVRRQPTGDLNDFFLNESPLKLVSDKFPQAPQRWAGNSPRNSPESKPHAINQARDEPLRGVQRTPTGDEADFAMLVDMDSDDDESTESEGQYRESKESPDKAQDEPIRGVKRTPTGDGLDFAAYLEEESESGTGAGESERNDTVKKEVSRGVKRTPTGDDLNFAMAIEDASEQASESAGISYQSSEPAVSPVAVQISAPIKQRGSVKRTPTGDEAEFALMRGIGGDDDNDDVNNEKLVDKSEGIPSPSAIPIV